MAKSMYDIIKKQNGEHFAKTIRNYDNGIFDITNIDKIVKHAGREAAPLMSYLISLKNIQIEEHAVHRNPIELLDKAGYDAYVADTLEKQNAISKYYKDSEKLCTFRDPNRFKKYCIINAVRKDVDRIKREDFKTPQRDDEYGTSVLSIQILKTGGFISIKNRYNHTVQNCDNTLNSNPDNIIPGLSDAIKHYFNVDFSAHTAVLPDKYIIFNNQIFNYTIERNNVYISENAYAKDGQIFDVDKNSEMMLGYGLLLNIKDKKITDLTRIDDSDTERDKFIQTLNDAIKDKKIQVKKNPLGGHDILADNKQILTIDNAKIVNINIQNAKYINSKFMGKLRGDLVFNNAQELNLEKADLSDVTKLTPPNNAETLNLRRTKLPAGEYDFSNVKYLNLFKTDLSDVTKLILPKNAEKIDLRYTILPTGKYDFSNVKHLNLNEINWDNITKLTLPKNAEKLDLLHTTLPAGEYDFSNVKQLDLYEANLNNITKLTLPKNAEKLDLGCTTLPAGEYDLGGVKDLNLYKTDLSNVTKLILPKNAEKLDLGYTKLPAGEYDLGGVKDLNLYKTDLSDVTKLILPKNAENLNLTSAKLPAGEYDFSNVKHLNLYEANLNNITKLTLPKNADFLDLEGVKLPAGEYDLSGVKDLYLEGADFSKATKLILPKGYKGTPKKSITIAEQELKKQTNSKLKTIQDATNKLKNKTQQRMNEYVQNTNNTVDR